MIVNSENLSNLFTGYKTSFQRGLDSKQPSQADVIATRVTSATKTENYSWLGQLPALREWIGPRQIQRFAAHAYALTNKRYELTWAVPIDDIEDDAVGAYATYSEGAGASLAMWPHQILFALFQTGDAVLCYDGQYFFDIDHPVGRDTPVSTSNLLNDGGAMAAHPWYLIDTTKIIKPMIWQLRKAPVMTSQTDLAASNVFELDEFRFGVKARGNAGFGLWQTALRNEAALTTANLEAAILAMNAFENDEGYKLGINPNILLIGAYHQFNAIDLLTRQLLDAAGAINPLVNRLQIVIVPELP